MISIASTPNRFYGQSFAALTYMSYRGFQIQTINYPTGWWHAHVEKDGAGFSTMPSLKRFEWEAYQDGERKIDGLILAAEYVDEDMEEVWQTN